MKIAIISTILVGLSAAQNTTIWDVKSKTCTLATEATACADMTNACCGTITTKVGSASNVVTTKCLQRNLVEDLPTYQYTTGTTTTVVTYSCLSSRPASYEVYDNCNDETTCKSGYCCGSFNYTIS